MTFEIKDMELDMGDATVFVSGRAKYHIDDIGNGFYEFGSIKGKDVHNIAVFDSCKITDWRLVDEMGRNLEGQGLTKQDINALEEVVVDELNYNLELCYELACDEPEPPEEE